MISNFFAVFGFSFFLLLTFEFILLLYFLAHDRFWYSTCSVVGVLAVLGLFGGNQLSDLGNWVNSNRALSVIYFTGYFLIGAAYVSCPFVGRWGTFVREIREINREKKQNWLLSIKNNQLKAEQDRAYLLTQRSNLVKVSNSLDEIVELDKKIADKSKEVQIYLDNFNSRNSTMNSELFPLWKQYESTAKCVDFWGRTVPITRPFYKDFKKRIIGWIIFWFPSLFWQLLNDPIRKIGTVLYQLISKSLENEANYAWKDEDKFESDIPKIEN